METRLVTFNIEKCVQCPYHKIIPDSNDDIDTNLKLKCSKSDRIVEYALRPYNVKYVNIPPWCSLEKVIKDISIDNLK